MRTADLVIFAISPGTARASCARRAIRQGKQWIAVTGLAITPPYPHDASLPANATFTLTFDETWGDGVRIIGRPGGPARFTTISELSAYYE